MSSTSAISIDLAKLGGQSISQELLVKLANITDSHEGALTFYFSSSKSASYSHKEEDIRFRNLIAQASSSSTNSNPATLEIARDAVRLIEPAVRRHPHVFHALFASASSGDREDVTLPWSSDIGLLHLSWRLELLPLVRAMQACEPYAVFLVESGKTRGFLVRGDEIEEDQSLAQTADVSLHAHRERTGWPHGVQANAEERRDRFFRHFAETARAYTTRIGASHLILGCRNDVGNQLEVDLNHLGANHRGRFHLTSFDMTPAEVLNLAAPEHLRLKKLRYQAFWKAVSANPAQSLTDSQQILQGLEQGQVRTICFGTRDEPPVQECGDCGRANPLQAARCAYCNGSAMHKISIAELSLRKALATQAEILAPWPGMLDETRTGAQLRF